MEQKHKFNNSSTFLNILYLLYILYFVKYLSDFGYINTQSKVYQFMSSIEIAVGFDFMLFQLIFIGMLLFSVENDRQELIIIKQDEKENFIKNKLVIYKLFVVLNVLIGMFFFIYTKNYQILFISFLLIVTSVAIHRAKEGYLISYIYDRKREYMEKITNNNYDYINQDTKRWRYKIWFNKRYKIKIKDRLGEIISNIFTILISLLFILASSSSIFNFIFVILLIHSSLALIENTFSLFTRIDGVCSGKFEEQRSGSSNITYYKIVVTDYNNKREIKIKTRYNLDVNDMDNLSIVHGIFTKQFVSINNLKLKERSKVNSIMTLVILTIFFIPQIVMMIKDNYYEYQNQNYLQEYEQSQDNELSFMDKQKLENDKTLLTLEELGNYKEIYMGEHYINEYYNLEIITDTVYVGENASKLYFHIINNSDRGMVLNIDYNTIITDGENKQSNILMSGDEYYVEMDILKPFDKKYDKLKVILEYTLSETIHREYREHTNYFHYPLNVVDKNVLFEIDLENNNHKVIFNEYDKFYNKIDIQQITRFE